MWTRHNLLIPRATGLPYSRHRFPRSHSSFKVHYLPRVSEPGHDLQSRSVVYSVFELGRQLVHMCEQ